MCVHIYSHIHTMEYHSAIKKHAILSFATTCMDLEAVMLNERNHTEKDKYHMISVIYGILNKTNGQTELNKQSHRYKEQAGGYQSRRGGKRRKIGNGV